MITVVPAKARMHTEIDWLDSWHSFSFGEHYDPDNTHHGLVLVNNDDVIAPGRGFGTHGHRDMEIITWVLVAEGVETSEALVMLREMGCDLAQGYWLSRPLPGPQALEWLIRHSHTKPASDRWFSPVR